MEDALTAHRLTFDPAIHIDTFQVHRAAKSPPVEEPVESEPPATHARPRMYPPAFFDERQQGGFQMLVDEAQEKGLIRSRWQFVLALIQGKFEVPSMQILQNFGVSC